MNADLLLKFDECKPLGLPSLVQRHPDLFDRAILSARISFQIRNQDDYKTHSFEQRLQILFCGELAEPSHVDFFSICIGITALLLPLWVRKIDIQRQPFVQFVAVQFQRSFSSALKARVFRNCTYKTEGTGLTGVIN